MIGQIYDKPVTIEYFFEKRNGWRKEIDGLIKTESIIKALATICKPFMKVIIANETIFIKDVSPLALGQSGAKVIDGEIDRVEVKVFYKEV